MNLTKWADSIDGKYLDLDAAPAQQPAQCHDVWLSYLYALGGKPGDGHAPGEAGWTSEVWRQFPTHRPGLARLFTRHDGKTIKAGDVVFWSAYDGNGLPHVAVALADAGQYSVYCLTQNPGAVHREYLTRRGVLGVLRPITKTPPTSKPAPPAAPTITLEELMATTTYVQDAATKGQGSIYALSPITGKKRKIKTAEWNGYRAAEKAGGEKLAVGQISKADLDAIPDA